MSSDSGQCNSSIYLITYVGHGVNLIWNQVLRLKTSIARISIYSIYTLIMDVFRKSV